MIRQIGDPKEKIDQGKRQTSRRQGSKYQRQPEESSVIQKEIGRIHGRYRTVCQLAKHHHGCRIRKEENLFQAVLDADFLQKSKQSLYKQQRNPVKHQQIPCPKRKAQIVVRFEIQIRIIRRNVQEDFLGRLSF